MQIRLFHSHQFHHSLPITVKTDTIIIYTITNTIARIFETSTPGTIIFSDWHLDFCKPFAFIPFVPYSIYITFPNRPYNLISIPSIVAFPSSGHFSPKILFAHKKSSLLFLQGGFYHLP